MRKPEKQTTENIGKNYGTPEKTNENLRTTKENLGKPEKTHESLGTRTKTSEKHKTIWEKLRETKESL